MGPGRGGRLARRDEGANRVFVIEERRRPDRMSRSGIMFRTSETGHLTIAREYKPRV